MNVVQEDFFDDFHSVAQMKISSANHGELGDMEMKFDTFFNVRGYVTWSLLPAVNRFMVKLDNAEC
jgi:hypothetical protein